PVLSMAFALGGNLGSAVLVSRYFGAKIFGEMMTAISTAFLSCAVLSAVLSIFGALFCPLMMRLIHTPENIFDDGVLYLNIYIYGLTLLLFYNVCYGIYTALGYSRQ